MYRTIFFDLDDTLYPQDNGLWLAILDRINLFMEEQLSLSRDVIPGLRTQYYTQYGTSMRGLQIHYGVEAEDFLAYVHNVPLSRYLSPRPELRSMLLSLPQNLWVFTNADADHAHRVIDHMGLDGCFEGVVDVRALGFTPKPELTAYQRAMNIASERDSLRCVMLDDAPRNLQPAHGLGFTTVLVAENGSANSSIDHHITDILCLPEVMPELWQSEPQPGS